MITENPKVLKIIIIVAFAIIIPTSIVGINIYEKNVTNPRIWEEWTCEKMEKFALRILKKKKIKYFQTSFVSS